MMSAIWILRNFLQIFRLDEVRVLAVTTQLDIGAIAQPTEAERSNQPWFEHLDASSVTSQVRAM